jgi:predicted nuclease with TOPRIM domain
MGIIPDANQIANELLRSGFSKLVSSPSMEEMTRARDNLRCQFASYDELLDRAAFLESNIEHLRCALEDRNQELNSLKVTLALTRLAPPEIFESIFRSLENTKSPLHPALERFAKIRRSKEAKKAGRVKPTSKDKDLIKTYWIEWKKDAPQKNKAAFVRKMQRLSLGVGCRDDVIRRWIREWEREINT